MKTKLLLATCFALFACGCQEKSKQKDNGSGPAMDDSNYEERRKQMKQDGKTGGGCCEAEKQTAPQQQNQTVSVPEIKVDKVQ